MPSTIHKRARPGESGRDQPKKRLRLSKKQRKYHSSSEEESEEDLQEPDVREQESKDDSDLPEGDEFEDEEIEAADVSAAEEDTDGSDPDAEAEPSARLTTRKKKRQDPDIFASSMSKILGSKLTSSKRADPVLARSKDAADATKEIADAKLEAKAKNKLKEEKKAALEKGRVKDVLALGDADRSTALVLEEEKRLKKTAQRGVIKLFNAVRAAQVKGEEAAREAKQSFVVGMDKRQEMATEMSKQGFLDLIASGGKKPAAAEA